MPLTKAIERIGAMIDNLLESSRDKDTDAYCRLIDTADGAIKALAILREEMEADDD